MSSFVDDLTAKVQQLNSKVNSELQSVKGLASSLGINVAPAAPATPAQPKPSYLPGVSNGTLMLLALGGLFAAALWKKM